MLHTRMSVFDELLLDKPSAEGTTRSHAIIAVTACATRAFIALTDQSPLGSLQPHPVFKIFTESIAVR